MRHRRAVYIGGSDADLFAFKPAMSLMPKEFTDRDPDFWAPTAVAPAGATRKPGDKP
jgi:hypothetical protein